MDPDSHIADLSSPADIDTRSFRFGLCIDQLGKGSACTDRYSRIVGLNILVDIGKCRMNLALYIDQ